MNNSYVRSLLRFWWLLAIGIGLAALVAVGSVDRIKPGIPPKLTPRKAPTYTSSASIMIDSGDCPYCRTSITTTAARGAAAAGSTGKAAAAAAGKKAAVTAVQTAPPDTNVLVNAANLYPQLIQGDQVARLREKTVGVIEGTVLAQTAFSSNRPYGSAKPSYLPLITISTTATTPDGAMKLASGTVDAFRKFLIARQDRAGVPVSQRLLVENVNRPAGALKVTNSSMTLPGGLFVVILGAFGGLAILLDRKFPRRDRHAAAPIGAAQETTG
jgi:hypothetical protein